MKFTAIAVAAALCLADSNTSAFTVQQHTSGVSVGAAVTPLSPLAAQNFLPQQPQRRGRLQPLNFAAGGMEELQELLEAKTNPLDKKARESPSLFKFAGYASIPVSAALGFGIVPSRRFAAHAAGAIITGVAGAIGKSKLDAITEDAAKPAIAQALVDNGIEDPDATAAKIKGLQETFGIVDDEEFESLCADIYSKYLLGMVKHNPIASHGEPDELDSVKTALSLTNLHVGEAHAAAANEWYRMTTKIATEEELDDPDSLERKAMDKFLFLTERTFQKADETQEAFKFEMTRVAKAMKLNYVEAMERVAEVAEPFYLRALKSTRAKLNTNQVSEAMLERARKTLGIEEETAFDMHIAAFNEEVKELCGLASEEASDDDEEADIDLSAAKFVDGAKDRLYKLRDVLSLSDEDANYEIAAEVTPLFQATALDTMKSVLVGNKTPDEAWEIMNSRRQELLLAQKDSKGLISSMVMQALGAPLEEAHRFSKVNNEEAVYANILEALDAKKALIAILTKSGWDEFDNFDKTFCDPWDRQSANGFLRSDERFKLYKIFLGRSLRKAEDGKLSDEAFGRMMEVKGLLGVSDEQAETESRATFGPELQKACLRATTEIVTDFTPELAVNMQKEIDDIMDNYRLSKNFLREQGVSCYGKAVALVSEKSPGGVPTNEMEESLKSLQKMFNMEAEDTYPAHMEYFGAVYRKSVLEAMGATGVIRSDFREALDDLRSRLGVNEEDSKKLFLEAVEEKMTPMVEWINSEMERTNLSQQQLAQRRGKDMGQDVFQSGKDADGNLGLGAEVNIMGDIMNLVDFYTENEIAEEKEVGTKEVDGKEVPVMETSYPVTALGSGSLDQEMAEALYRQMVVGAFTNQGPQAARYEASRAKFGGILGLTSEKMEEINDNIGSTVYDNYVSRTMMTKGSLDQQDMMFLANIQGKLGLSSEQSEKFLMESQKKVLSEEINQLMDDPTPAGLKAFREKCNSMGMDLAEDIGVSTSRLVRMFESEIVPGLKSGEINVENNDILTEIQESLNLEPEECETMFENAVLKLAKSAFDLINNELMRGRDDSVVDPLKELVRYNLLMEGDLGLSVDEATGYQIFNIYDAFDHSGEDEETVELNKELLKTAMGIE